jgi:hypothetical protein
VTINEVWIGNWIYLTLTLATTNIYGILTELCAPKFTVPAAHTHTHTHARAHSHSLALSLTRTLTLSLSLALSLSHSHTHSLTLTHSHTLSLTHTLTHSLTHTHSHSHTHTHTRRCFIASSNGRRFPSSGFPDWPRPQLSALFIM